MTFHLNIFFTEKGGEIVSNFAIQNDKLASCILEFKMINWQNNNLVFNLTSENNFTGFDFFKGKSKEFSACGGLNGKIFCLEEAGEG